MKVLYIALFASLLLVATGCKTQKKMVSFSELTGEWNLIELKGNVVNTGIYRQFVVFDLTQKTYSGNAGCNRMSGKLEYDEAAPGLLKFGRAMTTRMACPELEAEQLFLSAMEEVVRFEAKASDGQEKQLAFFDKNGAELFVIRLK